MDWHGISTVAREAFRASVNDWIGKARIQNGKINGPMFRLDPGGLTSLANMEAGLLPALTAARLPLPVAQALSKTLVAAWNDWTRGYQVVAPSAFPTFAAVPGPHAPPTPSIPIPLQAGSSAGEASLNSAILFGKLIAALRPYTGQAPGSMDQGMKGLADWVDSSFQDWKRTVVISGMIGQGSVPTFAPPYVPVGPVIQGFITPGGPVYCRPTIREDRPLAGLRIDAGIAHQSSVAGATWRSAARLAVRRGVANCRWPRGRRDRCGRATLWRRF